MEEELLTEQEKIQDELNAILRNCVHCKTRKDEELIKKAFRMANEAHKGMRRKSGEPFIMHPLAAARIVAEEIGMGVTSIVSTILHDVVEDTELTIENIENAFGKKVQEGLR